MHEPAKHVIIHKISETNKDRVVKLVKEIDGYRFSVMKVECETFSHGILWQSTKEEMYYDVEITWMTMDKVRELDRRLWEEKLYYWVEIRELH